MQISDFHNDFLTAKKPFSIMKKFQKEKYRVVGAIFRGNRSFKEVEKLAKKYNLIKGDLELAFEDVGYGNLLTCEAIARLKPLYVTLTWNGENNLGYGCNHEEGIKSDGFLAIEIFNKKKIAIDTAHISKKGFYDIIDSADTVINSHTCFSQINNHKRNISDEMISLIIQKNGLIGLTLYSPFLADKKATLASVNRHIDHFLQRFSHKNLCIGSDFYGCDEFPEGLYDYHGYSLIYENLKIMGLNRVEIDDILFNNLNKFINSRKK